MKINIGKKRPEDLTEIDYIYENYKPVSGPTSNRRRIGVQKWVAQLLVSGAVCLAVLGLFRLDIPFTGTVKSGIRYLLSYETDVQPVFYRVMQLASHVGNLEWPVIYDISSPTRTVAGSSEQLLLLPVSGNVVRVYGWVNESKENTQVFHEGIDIGVPEGTEVKAVAGATVINIAENPELGKYLLVKNDSGELVRYGNLSEIMVTEGQTVSAGDVIAKTGKSGVREPHLHFEVIVEGRPVDPLNRLGTENTNDNS